MVNPIAIAIPFFFVLIFMELGVAWWTRRSVYRFADAVSDLSCGLTQQVGKAFYVAAITVPFVWLYENGRFFDLDSSHWTTHVLAFLLVDFAYYWWHRWTHETQFGWASHVVHHQSEDYNLAVALRQSLTSTITNAPFILPLALVGIDPFVIGLHGALNTLYQFWIHSELIPKLGPIEWVFNTPSHHRVHHAVNPAYVDKNYAGVLIIWDRLFGTFVEEDEEAVYGTMDPLRNFDPLWANLQGFVVLWRHMSTAPSLRDAWSCLWASPAWTPPWLPERGKVQPLTRDEQDKYDPPVSTALAVYICIQFVGVGAALELLLLWDKTAELQLLAALGIYVVVTTVVWAGLTQARSWARAAEVLRLVLVVPGAFLVVGVASLPWAGAFAVFSGVLFAALVVGRRNTPDMMAPV